MLSLNNYPTQIWNTHFAPLIVLIAIYLFLKSSFSKISGNNILKVFFSGIFAGLLINFQISFGVSIFFGFVFIFLGSFIKDFDKYKNDKSLLKSKLLIFFVFLLGVFITYIPFIVFEVKHGFHQTQAIIFMLKRSIIDNSAITGGRGFSKMEIVRNFFQTLGLILKIPFLVTALAYLVSFIYVIKSIKKDGIKLSSESKKLLTILTVCCLSLLFVFLSSKNPIWDYYFDGLEIIFLLYLGLIAKYFLNVKRALIIWVIFIAFFGVYGFSKNFNTVPTYSSYNSEKHIVDLIYQDANGGQFNLYIYNPAIYTYDYDYIFLWQSQKYKFLPGNDNNLESRNITYLIIPTLRSDKKIDFINYRTPNNKYSTVKTWNSPDGTTILKRVKQD